ncbi:hypothetical protein [Flexithrix dorotheae]|uniref:hypothetical protein n=1 Tax=Flexithrix dorotheae TaxID=70993 RepID=UPI0003710359|nr:hypothetical protein [Flexithrix dorotheae]
MRSKSRRNDLIFDKEQKVFTHSQNVMKHTFESQSPEIYDEYSSLTKNYGRLLDEIKLITSVSDRLQNKLNKANEKIILQNQELQETVDLLTRAKISRKAATIVLLIAVILFLLSEGFIEPIIEGYVDNVAVGLLLKAIIALLLKPLEMVVEKILLKKATKTK